MVTNISHSPAETEALGERLCETYLRNKRYELDRWNAHLNRLTAWEMDEYADAL